MKRDRELKNITDNIKSYVWLYWIIWLVMTVIIFFIRFIYIGNSNDFPIELLMVYMAVLWIPIMFINMYEGKRLSSYLEKSYSNETKKFKNEFGTYKLRPLLSFLSKNNMNDNLLSQLSKNYKRFIIFTIFVFISLPILFFILMF